MFSTILSGIVSLRDKSSSIIVSHLTTLFEFVALFVILTFPLYVASPPEEAMELLIMGFIDRFREELPMEYAVELNALLKNYF